MPAAPHLAHQRPPAVTLARVLALLAPGAQEALGRGVLGVLGASHRMEEEVLAEPGLLQGGLALAITQHRQVHLARRGARCGTSFSTGW